MLTTTYSMVVLSSEQQNTRRILGKLEQCLHNASWLCADGVDRVWLERVLHKLVRVDRYCHQRKVELYVIPALRRASEAAAGVLDRLDALYSDAMRILLHACCEFERAATGAGTNIRALVSTIELYCRQMLARLSLEEDELFPVARQVLSTETWFQIAACFLSESTERHTRNQSPPAGMPWRRSYPRMQQVH